MKMLFPALVLTAATAAGAATPVAPRPAATAPSPVTRAAYTANVDANFKLNDTNHDGVLSKAEIAATEARAQQEIDAQIAVRRKQAFDSVDTNHDGSISYAEYTAATRGPAADDGTKALAALDTNHDGKVSLEEFRAPALKRFAAADRNGDGVVSLDEMRAQQ